MIFSDTINNFEINVMWCLEERPEQSDDQGVGINGFYTTGALHSLNLKKCAAGNVEFKRQESQEDPVFSCEK